MDDIKRLLYNAYIWMKSHIVESKRWHQPSEYKQVCQLYYGRNHIPTRSENTSGGIVKCQDLHRIYPNQPNGANILYLISSALPPAPIIMVRYAKKNGAMLVWNQNGVAYPGWHGPGWEKSNLIMKTLIHLSDHIIYQSRFCKLSADRYLGLPKKPYSILNNPVDTRVFIPASKKPDGFHILLAGSHHKFYRIKAAIEMMRHVLKYLPDAVLTIAGRYMWRDSHTNALNEATHLAAALNVSKHIVFEAEYSQEQAVDMMQNSHILLHTMYNDSCPRVVVEALSCGLPVVFSDSGGVPELVGKSAGIGVPAPLDWEKDHPPAPQDLAESVLRIAENYPIFADCARKRAVENLDVRYWLDRHREIFRHVLA